MNYSGTPRRTRGGVFLCRARQRLLFARAFAIVPVMNKETLRALQPPANPGVYYFLGPHQEILYIGKATSLRHRLLSYFRDDIAEKRSEAIARMVRIAVTVTWTETDSVLEALILETNLIRTHKPPYNTRNKDDKSYNHLIITREQWPRVLVVRGKDLAEKYDERDIRHHFGPFPSSQSLRDALKVVRRVFRFYDTAHPVGTAKSKVTRGKIDFNRQLGLYPAEENRREYLRTIRHLKLFFEGKKTRLIRELEKVMMEYAHQEAFEDAARVKRQLFALKHIEDIALLRYDTHGNERAPEARIEAYDVAHTAGRAMVGVMVVMEQGVFKKDAYRTFRVRGYQKSNDPGALKEILTRRLGHPEWSLPRVIVVDGNDVQKRTAEAVLRQHGLQIPVAAVVKNAAHKPERVLAASRVVRTFQDAIYLLNQEAHRFAISFHRTQRGKRFLDTRTRRREK